jgi:monoamine oxidase
LHRGGRARLPGLRADFLGRAHVDHWSRDPWTWGSYAAFLPGQYTRFAGFAGRSEGGVHFAGEHTAPLVDQGYLNGAVRTGVRAAGEVLGALGRLPR